MSRPLLRIGLLGAALALAGCVALPTNESPSAIERLARADNALERGDRDRARRGYRAVIEQAPELVSPHFQLGLIAYAAGEPDTAIHRLGAVLARDPGHVLATYNLAIVHLQQARMLLDQHERLAPVSAGRPALIDLRRAIDALGESPPTPP
jgi:tetratricopeptide (TPR) repeat protein